MMLTYAGFFRPDHDPPLLMFARWTWQSTEHSLF
jgi:hypothetical protein